MRPEVHHLVSLGTLITLVLAIVGAAIAWGQVRQQVSDHVDPERHAGIVLAGDVATVYKITELSTRQEGIVEGMRELRQDVRDVQADLVTIKAASAEASVERAGIRDALDRLLREIQRQNGGDP